MLIVHHLENSRSQRILWLLEELGVPYEIKLYKRDPKTMRAPADLRAVHPLGKSPVVTDGAVTVAESGAIVEYLVETYGKGRLEPAAGSPDRLLYRYYLHFAEGSMMPPLLMKLVFARLPACWRAQTRAQPAWSAPARQTLHARWSRQIDQYSTDFVQSGTDQCCACAPTASLGVHASLHFEAPKPR